VCRLLGVRSSDADPDPAEPAVAEDFATVAQDLVAGGVTTTPQLGAIGASAGGLLIWAAAQPDSASVGPLIQRVVAANASGANGF
jgi:hypothetical protein